MPSHPKRGSFCRTYRLRSAQFRKESYAGDGKRMEGNDPWVTTGIFIADLTGTTTEVTLAFFPSSGKGSPPWGASFLVSARLSLPQAERSAGSAKRKLSLRRRASHRLRSKPSSLEPSGLVAP